MIEIKIISDLEEAKKLWNLLSPEETIYDLWDFRYCFYKYSPIKLCFLAAYDDEKLVGLLPLQKNPKYGYEYFSEDACEENRPFVKEGYDYIIEQLYEAMPGPGKAYDISGENEFTRRLPIEDYIYVLPLDDIKSFDDYLQKLFSSNSRWHLKKSLKQLDDLGVEVLFDDFSNLENLFIWNIQNFGDDSYLQAPDQQAWRDLLELPFEKHSVSISIGGEKAAMALVIYYRGIYYYLITGVNREFSGAGKYLAKVSIEQAISLKAKLFSAGLGDCNWKIAWHLSPVPQYLFIK